MADDPRAAQPFTLKRWSQRKLAAARAAEAEPGFKPPQTHAAPTPAVIPETAAAATAEAPALPPVESLTFDSDFAAFMKPNVDEATKRAAVQKLFTDPSFNAMDGLDIYVGDYTQSDPMPAGLLEKLSAVYSMLDPPRPSQDDKAAESIATPDGAAPAAGAEALVSPTVEPQPVGEVDPPAVADDDDAEIGPKPA